MRSNIIKAANVKSNQPKFITIRIPVIDNGCTTEQMRKKMFEELDKLLNEFCNGPVDEVPALSEMYDVVQVMAGYLVAAHKQHMSPQTAIDHMSRLFRNSNDQHIEKIKNYAADRGWVVILE